HRDLHSTSRRQRQMCIRDSLRRGPLYPAELRAEILISARVGRRLTIVNEIFFDTAEKSQLFRHFSGVLL
ncbi:MAG: hypothetical protein KUG67_02330, partial [Proteobacteria bacterium]|nr:hypothetical protein [Pseudomonadota bacterium]